MSRASTMMTLSASERDPISTILMILALIDGGDRRGRRRFAVTERARDHGAHRSAAALAGNDAGDVDAGLLEKALVDRNAIWRAGRIGLVLGDQNVFRHSRPRRGHAECGNAQSKRGDRSLAAEHHDLPCGYPERAVNFFASISADVGILSPGWNRKGMRLVLPDIYSAGVYVVGRRRPWRKPDCATEDHKP